MTLGTVTIGQARKDGRTMFSLSAMGSASLLPWRARQADHPRTIAKTRAANIAASSATKGCKEGVAACQRWFQRVERKWVIIRGDVNHGPTGQLAELWRLRPSPGRSIGRPLRCGVFHIVNGPCSGVVVAPCSLLALSRAVLIWSHGDGSGAAFTV